VVSLGEGFTPLVRASRLGKQLGLNGLYIRDEGRTRPRVSKRAA
jgi:threonine synthase